MVKEFTDQLKDQKATIVELEKQLSTCLLYTSDAADE